MARPKICVLLTGGTIGMTQSSKSKLLQPSEKSFDLIRKIPEIQKHLELDYHIVSNIDSSNIQPTHWTKLANKIHSLYRSYQSFVVFHGTDTMAYTASALSYALANLNKPIIFTGSLIPLSEIGSDGRNNLIHACLSATTNIAEVCIVFANKILRGNRTKKHHESFTDIFHSPNYPELGELNRPTILHDWRKKRRKRNLSFQPEFDPKVSLLKLFPGFDPEIINKVVERGAHAIIIEGFGPGNIPFQCNTLVPALEHAIKSKIPVIMANQMERGVTNMKNYEAGHKALEIGAISSHDMTTEATVTKLMWALAQDRSIKSIRKIFETNIAGEMSISE